MFEMVNSATDIFAFAVSINTRLAPMYLDGMSASIKGL